MQDFPTIRSSWRRSIFSSSTTIDSVATIPSAKFAFRWATLISPLGRPCGEPCCRAREPWLVHSKTAHTTYDGEYLAGWTPRKTFCSIRFDRQTSTWAASTRALNNLVIVQSVKSILLFFSYYYYYYYIIIISLFFLLFNYIQLADHKNELSNKHVGMWALTGKVRQGSSKQNFISSLKATDSLRNKLLVSSGSPLTSVSFLPMVLKKLILSTFHDHIVSTNTGTKRLVCWSAEYFVFLFDAALSAAAPAIVDLASTCDAAIVSGKVTSHIKAFPVWPGDERDAVRTFPITSC